MLKPFAVSRREQFVLTKVLINLPTDDKEERKKRRQVWEELGVRDLRRGLMREWSPAELREQQERRKTDPDYVHPEMVFAWQWGSDEQKVRVGLHGTTVDYLISKLGGKLDGGTDGEVLGELHDRLVSLRDSAEPASITSKDGTGYKLPEALWTPEEVAMAAHLATAPAQPAATAAG